MSQFMALSLAILCVALTAIAQLLLKMGMSSPAIQRAMAGSVTSVYLLAITNPLIWAGMLFFAASAGLWLLVLGKLDVSMAYPLTALGLVATTLAGIFLLGEVVSMAKLIGIALILAGVLVLAAGK